MRNLLRGIAIAPFAIALLSAGLLVQGFDAEDYAITEIESEEQLRENTDGFKRSQERLREYFKAHGHESAPRTRVPAERGIVISAGGRKLLTNAFVVVKVIREAHGCRLPIEIFYDGEDEADEILLEALQRIPDVHIRDASQLPRPEHLAPWPAKLHGYAKKVFSLYSTGFRQVLAIDSDNQPLTNPEALFDLPQFLEHGAVFWPDYWKANSAREAPQEEIYRLLGLELPWAGNRDWAAVESGQILLDKCAPKDRTVHVFHHKQSSIDNQHPFTEERHEDALDWVMWLNIWSEVTYEYVLGDKDTFEMGFMLSGKHAEFYRIPTPPRTALTTKSEEHGAMLHVGMVQSVEGKPTFLHRTSCGKFDPTKSVNEHPRPAFFTEPLSVRAAKQFVWDTAMGINTLPNFVVRNAMAACKDLDPQTLNVLRSVFEARKLPRSFRHLARRFSKCKKHRTDADTETIAVLPIQLYGEDTARAVSHSYIAFQELRRILRPKGQQRRARLRRDLPQ